MQKQARANAIKKIMQFAQGMMGEKIKGRYPDSVSVTVANDRRKEDDDNDGDDLPKDGEERKAAIRKRLGM